MNKMRKYVDKKYTDESKKLLNELFSRLRKQGFMAKQNFLCCGGCASYALASRIGELVDADGLQREKIKGVVFYHSQDTERLRNTGKVFLSYGPVDTEVAGPVGIDAVSVGNAIKKICEDLKLKIEWDGKGNSRICIDISIPRIPKTVPEFNDMASFI